MFLLAGCSGGPSGPKPSPAPVELVIGPVVQKRAPLQVVSVTPSGDNALASVVVKNTTGRLIQDFNVTWSVFRPANCAVNGSAPYIQGIMRGSRVVHAEPSGPGPHEQTVITSLSLSKNGFTEKAQNFDARKLRVQGGIAAVNFADGDHPNHSGSPDWWDQTVERTNILDAEDAASQACK